MNNRNGILVEYLLGLKCAAGKATARFDRRPTLPQNALGISPPGSRQAKKTAIANSIPRTTDTVRSMACPSAPPEYDGAPPKPASAQPFFQWEQIPKHNSRHTLRDLDAEEQTLESFKSELGMQ